MKKIVLFIVLVILAGCAKQIQPVKYDVLTSSSEIKEFAEENTKRTAILASGTAITTTGTISSIIFTSLEINAYHNFLLNRENNSFHNSIVSERDNVRYLIYKNIAIGSGIVTGIIGTSTLAYFLTVKPLPIIVKYTGTGLAVSKDF